VEVVDLQKHFLAFAHHEHARQKQRVSLTRTRAAKSWQIPCKFLANRAARLSQRAATFPISVAEPDAAVMPAIADDKPKSVSVIDGRQFRL
jgi:hypothetical protein